MSRKAREFALWTPRVHAGNDAFYSANPVTGGMATFRFPDGLKRGTEKREMDLLTERIRKLSFRYGYDGRIRIYIENGAKGGYHFHATFHGQPPEEDFVEALCRSWLRHLKLESNERKAFHFNGRPRSTDDTTKYATKRKRGSFCVKLRATEYQSHLAFMPFRTLQKCPRGSTSARTSCTPVSNGRNPLNPLLAAGGSVEEPPHFAGHVHLKNREDMIGGEEKGKKEWHLESKYTNPPPIPAHSRIMQKVGVRVSPLYGPGDVLLPFDTTGILPFICALSEHYPVIPETIRPPLPSAHPDAVEAVFLIPYGEVLNFEREAVRLPGARLFRE